MLQVFILVAILQTASAVNWGSFKNDGCIRTCYRQYSAILWNIPWFHSWENTCASTSATVQGVYFSKPSRCVNTGNMWGQFDVYDTSCCPYWGSFKKDYCKSDCYRQYSAILWNISPGTSWENTCASKNATVQGVYFNKPSRCVNTGLNQWGEFDVYDTSCCPYWGSFKNDGCIRSCYRQYSAILSNIPWLHSWENTCASTSATVQGEYFSKPSRCVIKKECGEFDVYDTSCCPNWGSFKNDGCIRSCYRQYSAILWNIFPGTSWENTCASKNATVEGVYFDKPSRCVNTGFNEWGEFEVNDNSCCPYWGSFKKDSCISNCYRKYSAILWNILPGNNWRIICQLTNATVQGVYFSKPSRCIYTGLNEWGEFDVKDKSCCPYWGLFQKESCISDCYRKYSATLLSFFGITGYKEDICESTSATVQGVYFDKPSRCVFAGYNDWGEFDVLDTSCCFIDSCVPVRTSTVEYPFCDSLNAGGMIEVKKKRASNINISPNADVYRYQNGPDMFFTFYGNLTSAAVFLNFDDFQVMRPRYDNRFSSISQMIQNPFVYNGNHLYRFLVSDADNNYYQSLNPNDRLYPIDGFGINDVLARNPNSSNTPYDHVAYNVYDSPYISSSADFRAILYLAMQQCINAYQFETNGNERGLSRWFIQFTTNGLSLTDLTNVNTVSSYLQQGGTHDAKFASFASRWSEVLIYQRIPVTNIQLRYEVYAVNSTHCSVVVHRSSSSTCPNYD